MQVVYSKKNNLSIIFYTFDLHRITLFRRTWF